MSHITIREALPLVRVHDLPLMAMNGYVGRVIDNAIRQIEEVDIEAMEVEWGKFMLLWVKLDITKP